MAKRQVDILIIGGGLTGATLMLALANKGYSTLLVEAKPLSDRIDPNFDARTLALSPASVKILQMIHVWPLLEDYATAIKTIHVSEQTRFGSTWMHANEKNCLGYVVEMQYINRALYQLLASHQIIAPATLTALDCNQGVATVSSTNGESTLNARLIVAADGTDSFVRQLCQLPAKNKDYGQHAIVANIGLARPHHNHAYERFTASGPLALLPMTDARASLVWALTPPDAERLVACEEKKFLQALQLAFGYRLGRFVRVGKRVVYPLKQVVMPQQVAGRVVFVGNAAHALHPVAGQGFNLGLRDISTLAQCIAEQGLDADMLQTYQQARRHDQTAIIHLTDSLVNLFSCNLPGLGIARGMALSALDNCSLLKNLLARYARGFAGVAPDLVCGIPLHTKEAQ